MASSITEKLMSGGKGGASASPLSDMLKGDEAAPEGSEGEMAAEDFANATDAAARYAAFKRMFSACEAEGSELAPAEGDDEETEY